MIIMAKQQSITSLPQSPDDDRRSRLIRYSIAMTIRVICLIACLFVHGWWLMIPAIGAVVLPYIAVVLANATVPTSTTVLRPGGGMMRAPVDPPVATTGPSANGRSGLSRPAIAAVVPVIPPASGE